MDREMLDFIIASSVYFPHGTKEACIKAREYIKYGEKACVSKEEFEEAVKTLIAYTFLKEDDIPDFWYCDSDCQKYSGILCEGECNVDEKAKKICPYFTDSSLK